MLRYNIDNYVKECNVYLVSKIVEHKLYNDLQSLQIFTHYQKNLLIDFVIGLPI